MIPKVDHTIYFHIWNNVDNNEIIWSILINNIGNDDPKLCNYLPEWEGEIPESSPPSEPLPAKKFLLILLLFMSLIPSKFRLPVITLVLDIFWHARNLLILIIQKYERCLQKSMAMLLSHKWNSFKILAKNNYKTKLKVSQTHMKIWNNHIYYFDYYLLLYSTL